MKKVFDVLKKIFAVIKWILFIGLVVLALYVFSHTLRGKAADFFGYKILYVVTGSMEPGISVNDYVVVKETDVSSLMKDDIIAYYSREDDTKDLIIIHRIIKVLPDNSYITKGDANTKADDKPIDKEQIIGKYKGKMWFLNWLTSFASLKKILMLVVIIPMFMISIYEARTLTKLTKKAFDEKKDDDIDDNGEKAIEPLESYEEKVERWKREAIEEYLNQNGEK